MRALRLPFGALSGQLAPLGRNLILATYEAHEGVQHRTELAVELHGDARGPAWLSSVNTAVARRSSLTFRQPQ